MGLPDIETYIGNKIPVATVTPELLAAVNADTYKRPESSHAGPMRRGGGRPGGGGSHGGGRQGSRPGGNRRRPGR